MKVLIILISLFGVTMMMNNSAYDYRNNPICYDRSACQPEQIHISFGDNINDITIMWSTFDDTTESRVQYGIGLLNEEEYGFRTDFDGDGSRQFIHRVYLKNLKYNTRYVYHCGSKYAWSTLYSFKTPPKENDATIRAIIIGDMGVENAQCLPYLQQEIQSNYYNFLLHVGDFAYNMQEMKGVRGDQFMRQIESMAAIAPYMTSPGNHEEHRNFTHYKNRFTMPQYNKWENMYYSWNIGPIHFISINTEAFYFIEEYSIIPLLNLYDWLVKDLEEANEKKNRRERPWIIIYGHRPMYCSNGDDLQECSHELTRYGVPACGKSRDLCRIEPLLRKYGVDIAIWAHEHSYERTWPVFSDIVHNGSVEKPYVNAKATIHIVSGAAGSRETPDPFVEHPADWSAFRSSDYSYTCFSAHNRTHLNFEQISASKHGKPIDSFWVIKDLVQYESTKDSECIKEVRNHITNWSNESSATVAPKKLKLPTYEYTDNAYTNNGNSVPYHPMRPTILGQPEIEKGINNEQNTGMFFIQSQFSKDQTNNNNNINSDHSTFVTLRPKPTISSPPFKNKNKDSTIVPLTDPRFSGLPTHDDNSNINEWGKHINVVPVGQPRFVIPTNHRNIWDKTILTKDSNYKIVENNDEGNTHNKGWVPMEKRIFKYNKNDINRIKNGDEESEVLNKDLLKDENDRNIFDNVRIVNHNHRGF